MGEGGALIRGEKEWVLLLTKNDFLEANDGGSKRVHAVVRALEAAGFTVEAVPGVTSDRPLLPGGSPARELFAFVKVLMLYARVGSLSSLKWLRPSAVRHVIRLIAVHGSIPAATVVEFTQMLPYHAAVGGPLLVDMHNIESGLLRNYSTSAASPLKRVLATYETARMASMERCVAERADAVVFVSDSDRLEMETIWRSRGLHVREIAVASNGIEDEILQVLR